MLNRLAITALGLTLLLGACGSGSSSEPKASTATAAPEATSVTTVVSDAAPAIAPAPAAGPPATVRTDDLEADLRAVDQELGGTQQSVNQANDTSPDRADG